MRALLLFICIWGNGFSILAQVLSTNQHVGCEGTPTTFYVNYPKPISTYQKAELIFGDGQSVDLLVFHNPKVHHYYYPPGNYTPLLKLSEAGQASQSYSIESVEILEAPEFKMFLSGNDSQCFNKHLFEWQGPWKSSSGSDLSKWEWDFGDGSKMNKQSPEHQYSSPGTYSVSLTCRDENGCEQSQARLVTVHDSFRAHFNVLQDSFVSGSIVRFVNNSTIDSANIASWIWDWGSGRKARDTFSFDTIPYLWNHINRPYEHDGYSSPKLVVRSKNSCFDSFLLKDAIRILKFNFDIAWIPGTPCFSKNQIRFNMPPRPNATQLKWSFGDSLDAPRTNYDQKDWSPAHHYTQPGYYKVNMEVLEPPAPRRDTTVCFVKVKGPMAKILRNKKRNNHIPVKPIGVEEYQKLKNDVHYRLRSGTDSIRYWRIKRVKPYVIDSTPVFVNAPMQSSRVVESTCKGDTVWRPTYSLQATSYQKVFQDYILVDSGYWNYQSPLPTDTLYHPPSGKHYMHNMHDTDLYHPSPFNMVQFSNNSVKYRLWGDSLKSQKPLSLRYAWDNIPGEFPDKGRNPNFPWASDSLHYFWDFGDAKAPKCTSTVSAPNPRCAYSTEVAPRHMYRDMGMYYAILNVHDSVCDCSHADTLTITMVAPKLSQGKVFNWYEQNRFDSLGKNINLGFRMKGYNCANQWADQKPDFAELGFASDQIDNYWLVFDTDEQCDTIFYSFNDNGISRDSFYLDCDWISKKEFETNKAIYNYNTGGWKSIGVVIRIGNAYDTLFIKNYKWIHHPKPQIALNYDIKPLADSFELKISMRDSTSMYDSTELFQFFISSLNEDYQGYFSDSLKFPEGKDTSFYTRLSAAGIHRLSWLGVSDRYQSSCYDQAPLFLPQNTRAFFNVDEQSICVNQKLKFTESVTYYEVQNRRRYAGARARNEIYEDQWIESRSLEPSIHDLFNDVYRKEVRQKWLKSNNYKLPEFEEQLAWDFDGDSLFDAYGNQPSWSYREPGLYHPKLYVRDSTGFWLRVGLEVPIEVLGAKPTITVDNTQKTFVCAGLPVNFSTVFDSSADISNYLWNVSPKGPEGKQSTFQWIPETAGSYIISLQAATEEGCVEQSHYGPISIRAPEAGFQISPYQDSCAQLDFKLQNRSTNADTLYWLLNGNILAKTDAADQVYDLQLPYYGNHFLSQLAVGQLYDSTLNNYVSCNDAYPKADEVGLSIPGNPSSEFRVLRELSDWGTLAFTPLEKGAETYLWTFDGNISATKADTVWYKNGRNGDYEVCLQVIKGEAECSSKTCKTVWLRDLGLTTTPEEQIQVFPTLVEDHFTIETNSLKPGNTTYSLQDISGTQVQQGATTMGRAQVNIALLPAGSYILTVCVNNACQVVKLIKL